MQEPIVSCELGNLFNKPAILTALLEKTLTSNFSYIRGLKDLKNLIFTPNPNYSSHQETEGNHPAKFICPITKIEMNGSLPFVVIWTTGYVISEKAIKEIGIDGLQLEYGPFSSDDIVKIAPLEDEVEHQIQAMIARRARSKSQLKRSHEDKKVDAASAPTSSSAATADNGDAAAAKKSKKSKKEAVGQASTAAASSSSASSSAQVSIRQSASLVKSAAAAIQGQQQGSQIYQNLFHSDKEKKMKDRDLFMAVAGLRYSI